MKGSLLAMALMLMLSGSPFLLLAGSGYGTPEPLYDGPVVDWIGNDSIFHSTHLNGSSDLLIDHSTANGNLSLGSTFFDPYLEHNSTVREAIDMCPQWLNGTLSWRFHDISDINTWKYTSILLDPDQDPRFIDEIAFFIAHSGSDLLNSYYTVPELIVENIEMMYRVASDVDYADITDTNLVDGAHSTLVYRIPSGNVTLPEEIYYGYLMMPRNEMEDPAYINLTTFNKTTEEDEGVFWRSFLYSANDTDCPVLKEMLSNETSLWNGTRNRMNGNGAVGAVTRWETEVMDFNFVEGMRRDRQPVSLYKQHFGLCGENAQVLVAAAKTALIPTVMTINMDMMHAWNEFYERGWHQWEGYSGRIDDPGAEGLPGMVTVMTSLDPDGSMFSNTGLYTFTSNLTVNVRDMNGVPVDGAMVRIFSQPMTNDPKALPLLGNATDVNGSTDFIVGSGFQYFVQILSPIGGWLEPKATLPLAFPSTDPGGTHVFNVTLNATMSLMANLSSILTEREFGVRFDIHAEELLHRTRFHRDPWGGYEMIEKSYPDRTGIEVFFLDDGNLSSYLNGSEFHPTAVMNLSEGENDFRILPDDRDWHLVISGSARPLTRTYISISVNTSRSVVEPIVRIVSPSGGRFLVGELIEFRGSVYPLLPSMEPVHHVWKVRGSSAYLSAEMEFYSALPWGIHTIEYIAFNDTGMIGIDVVELVIEHPNRPPVAVMDGPEEGSVLDFGTVVSLSAERSHDPDNDTLSFLWRSEMDSTILSDQMSLERSFQTGNHHISLTARDPEGLEDTVHLNFTILESNLAPVSMIHSPGSWDIYTEGDVIFLSANGSYDLDGDMLSYRWEDSMSGNISYSMEDNVILPPGIHTLTLFVSDGKESSSSQVRFHVVEMEEVPDLEPVPRMLSPVNGKRYYVNEMITLSGEGSYDPEGNDLTFSWVVDGNIVSTECGFALFLGEGVHSIILEVSDGKLSASVSSTVVVADRHPILSLVLNGTELNSTDERILAEDVNYTFDGSGSFDPDGQSLSFAWKISDEVISTEEYLTRSFEPGIYYLELEISDPSGRASSKTILLRVLDDGENGTSNNGTVSSGGDDDVPLVFYIVPVVIILISLGIIVFSLVRSRSITGKEDDQERLD